jgi:hypothetical protein
MDIEGWEFRVLQRGRRSLTSWRISADFIEVLPEALRRAGASAGELIDTLEEYGFDMYFSGLWDEDHGHGPEWKQATIHGESLRFARALPLPDEFTQGDLLVIHRTHALASAVRSAVAR